MPVSKFFKVTEVPPEGFEVTLAVPQEKLSPIPAYEFTSPRIGSKILEKNPSVPSHSFDTTHPYKIHLKKPRIFRGKHLRIGKKSLKKKIIEDKKEDKLALEGANKITGCVCFIF